MWETQVACETTMWHFFKTCMWYGIGGRPYMIFAIWLFYLRVEMLVHDSEWEISWFYTGHFTHMAEITCPYGTMPLTETSHSLSKSVHPPAPAAGSATWNQLNHFGGNFFNSIIAHFSLGEIVSWKACTLFFSRTQVNFRLFSRFTATDNPSLYVIYFSVISRDYFASLWPKPLRLT